MSLLNDSQLSFIVYSYIATGNYYDLQKEIRDFAWKKNTEFLEEEYKKGLLTKRKEENGAGKYVDVYYLDCKKVSLYSTEIRIDGTWLSNIEEIPKILQLKKDLYQFAKEQVDFPTIMETE